jgi:protein-S-isoprenylcysteine O-methyltransferase Ste14
MVARALLAVLVLPGIFAGVVPWVIAAHDPWRAGGNDLGTWILGAGIGVVILCVRDFLVIGRGTLAPWDPPTNLVVVGLYRHVRNPMYVGVLVILAGTAICTGSPLVALYAVIVAIAFHLRVISYEEPRLAAQFGSDWTEYSRRVSRWLPSPRPSPRGEGENR